MIIAGNWKMNQTKAAAVSFCAMLNQSSGRIASGRQMLLFPAFVHLDCVLANLADSPVEVGGQTCHPEHKGAHTGDISAPMLADLGCDWVLLGHSERRADHFEDDRLIAASLTAARAAGLKIMLCVGETRAHKEAGEAESVVAGQLAGALGPASGWQAGELAIAYEPVWAIGTGLVASLDDIEAMHNTIIKDARQLTGLDDVPVLYGGSVNPGNAADILALPPVSGALVGGASLNAEDFLAIFDAAPAS